jgi:drug/metabolite transporter (DMT)-like permease
MFVPDRTIKKPAVWALVLAFALVYISWGTTYLAIRVGVKTLPPGLFAGLRISSAGLLLFGFLWLRGDSLRLGRRDLLVSIVVAGLMFVAGNGLVTIAELTVESGVASVLVATTPLWVALIEWLRPRGERLAARGWVGVLIGLGGVLVLFVPRLSEPASFWRDVGPLLVLCSSMCWAAGSVVLRSARGPASHLVSAAYQMVLGGIGLTLIGVLSGEVESLTAKAFTPEAVFAFFYLLIVGSLIGYIAYTWLLQHVRATLAGTYAYVNPAVALLVGWLLGGETITGWLVGGLATILAGVALVRTGAGGRKKPSEPTTLSLKDSSGSAYSKVLK